MTPPSMRVGDVEVQGLSDGVLQVSLDIVIGMERTTADQLLGGTENGSFYIPVNNFLIRRGGRTILIDAGAGNTMQPTLGKLHDNLRAAGVDPSVVTNIVLTHLHPDHANGLVDDAGAAIQDRRQGIDCRRQRCGSRVRRSGADVHAAEVDALQLNLRYLAALIACDEDVPSLVDRYASGK